MPNRISIVIPVKDDAEKLESCLAALSLQTSPPDEVIVVDNDSSDETPEVALRWGATYLLERRPGIAAAASAGYDAAGGEVIARLDADSRPAPGWVQRLRHRFDGDPDLAAVTGPGIFSSLPPRRRRVADRAYMTPYFSWFGAIIGGVPVFGSNFAMTRRAWHHARDSIHRFDPEVHDDLDLSFHLPRDGRVMLDRALQVEISARPFVDPRAFARRIRRGFGTVHRNRHRLRRPRPVVSAVVGRGLQLAMGAILTVRRPRPIHAAGIVLEGSIRRIGPPAVSGLGWVDELGESPTPVVGRLSRSVGLPGWLPDVIGLAIRFEHESRPADIELASSGVGVPSRFLLRPRRSPSRATLGTILPYRGARGPVLLAARTVTPARLPADHGRLARALGRETWVTRLYHADAIGTWRPFAELRLRRRQAEDDDALRFDAVENPLPGSAAYAWTVALRQPSYRLARGATRRRPAPPNAAR